MLTSKGAINLNQSGGIKVVGYLRFILGAKDTRDLLITNFERRAELKNFVPPSLGGKRMFKQNSAVACSLSGPLALSRGVCISVIRSSCQGGTAEELRRTGGKAGEGTQNWPWICIAVRRSERREKREGHRRRQEYSRDRGEARVEDTQIKQGIDRRGLCTFSDSWTRMWRELASRQPPAGLRMFPYGTHVI